jgi:hypothetical protein
LLLKRHQREFADAFVITVTRALPFTWHESAPLISQQHNSIAFLHTKRSFDTLLRGPFMWIAHPIPSGEATCL